MITDFDFMKEAFAQKELSNRDYNAKIKVDTERNVKHYEMDKQALEILGAEDQLIKNGPGYNSGLADGPYDDFHRKFRTIWYETTKKLTGRNRIIEIIEQSSESVNRILGQKGSSKEGIDPKAVFVNGTMNVITGLGSAT